MEIAVYRLSVYVFNSYIDGIVEGYIIEEVIDLWSTVIQTVYCILYYLL